MADIVLTIPNAQIARAIDALCTAGGYTGSSSDEALRRDFAREVLAGYVRRTVMEVERSEAMTAAMATVSVAPITIS